MAECPHYLELPTGVPDDPPQVFLCDLPLDHKKKHRRWISGQGIGPRPMGGKARKRVEGLIEWDR